MLRRLVEVVSFGPVGLTAGAFACTDGVKLPAEQVPDASLWNNGHQLFLCAKEVDEAITRWDTFAVIRMARMFEAATVFNQPLNGWNTSNVIDMRGMFEGATAFNQPLNTWNTSKVTNMNSMFKGASVFNQNLKLWDVTKVTDMENIFSESGITKPNYCAVKSLPVWKDADLGVSFICP